MTPPGLIPKPAHPTPAMSKKRVPLCLRGDPLYGRCDGGLFHAVLRIAGLIQPDGQLLYQRLELIDLLPLTLNLRLL